MSSLLMIATLTAPLAFEPVSRLRRIAEQAVAEARPGAQVTARLDPNLHLAVCGKAPTATVQGSGNTPSVMLSCQGPRSWTIYVPVQVQQLRPVVVLTQPLAAGQPFSKAILQLQKRDIAGLSQGYFSSPAALKGAIAAHALAAGAVPSPADVNAAPVVHRGQTVTLEFKSGGLDVQTNGLALADAAPGQQLRVENSASHRIVSGIVQSNGRVAVGR